MLHSGAAAAAAAAAADSKSFRTSRCHYCLCVCLALKKEDADILRNLANNLPDQNGTTTQKTFVREIYQCASLYAMP